MKFYIAAALIVALIISTAHRSSKEPKYYLALTTKFVGRQIIYTSIIRAGSLKQADDMFRRYIKKNHGFDIPKKQIIEGGIKDQLYSIEPIDFEKALSR